MNEVEKFKEDENIKKKTLEIQKNMVQFYNNNLNAKEVKIQKEMLHRSILTLKSSLNPNSKLLKFVEKQSLCTMIKSNPDKTTIKSDPDKTMIKDICTKMVGAKIKFQYEITLEDGETNKNTLNNCNIIGDCFEDILYSFIRKKVKTFERGPKQSSPDFWNRNKEYDWELKCFQNNPNFDISNFTSYLYQLEKENGVYKKMFSTNYLVFQYTIHESYTHINSFWMLNVWNMVGYNKKYPITLQNKKGMWYNVRPSNHKEWNDKDKTPQKFITNFCKAIQECPNKIEKKDEIISSIQKQFDNLIIDKSTLR